MNQEEIHREAVRLKEHSLFALFEVSEIEDVLKQVMKLRDRWPGYHDGELLLYELLVIAKLK